jgi:hypothetical protein
MIFNNTATITQTIVTNVYTLRRVVYRYVQLFTYLLGARVGAVVEALRYKQEGRGFDYRCCHWNISLT